MSEPVVFETADSIYRREGTCNNCGACCKNEQCPHLVKQGDIFLCGIWEHLAEPCIPCSAELIRLGKPKRYTHAVCIRFPDHPFLDVIKNKKCSFTFVEEKKS